MLDHGSEPVVVGSSAAPPVETHTSSLLLHGARSLIAEHPLGKGTGRDPDPVGPGGSLASPRATSTESSRPD
eukprot:749740-Hanusia_phi.AAC.1